MQLEWSPRAQRDLQAIHDYITHDSPIRAWKFVQRLGTATLSLQTFPLMGRPVPEVIDNADIILELIFRKLHIDFYQDPLILYLNFGKPGNIVLFI